MGGRGDAAPLNGVGLHEDIMRERETVETGAEPLLMNTNGR